MSRSPLVTKKSRKKQILKITQSSPVKHKTTPRKMMALLASLTQLLIRLLIRESKEGDAVAVEATEEATSAEVITKQEAETGVTTAITMEKDLALDTRTEAIIEVIAIIGMGTAPVLKISIKVMGTVIVVMAVPAIKIKTVKLSALIVASKIIKATEGLNATIIISHVGISNEEIMTGDKSIKIKRLLAMITVIIRAIENLTLTTGVATMITIVAAEEAAIEAVVTSNNAKKTTKLSSMTRSSCQNHKATKTQTKWGKMIFKRLTSALNAGTTAGEAATSKKQRCSPKTRPKNRVSKLPPQMRTCSLEDAALN